MFFKLRSIVQPLVIPKNSTVLVTISLKLAYVNELCPDWLGCIVPCSKHSMNGRSYGRLNVCIYSMYMCWFLCCDITETAASKQAGFAAVNGLYELVCFEMMTMFSEDRREDRSDLDDMGPLNKEHSSFNSHWTVEAQWRESHAPESLLDQHGHCGMHYTHF